MTVKLARTLRLAIGSAALATTALAALPAVAQDNPEARIKKLEAEVRALRMRLDLHPVFKRIDSCAAEFEAYTPYYYSTYEDEDEVRSSPKKKYR